MKHIDYTIGDDIVCIQTHSKRVVKEGELKVALALTTNRCKCQLVDVGIKATLDIKGNTYNCLSCGQSYICDGIWWLNPNLFKKLDTLVDISELTEILEQPAFS